MLTFCFFYFCKIKFFRNSSGDPFIIFSGGMPSQTEHQQISTNSPSSKPSSYFLTILRGQTTNVLHMDNSIVDFHVISPSPHIAGLFNYKN
jgi:hypothetical protein